MIGLPNVFRHSTDQTLGQVLANQRLILSKINQLEEKIDALQQEVKEVANKQNSSQIKR